MEKHIEKLMSFIEINNPSKALNTLSRDDKELKESWKQAQSDKEWRKITSRQDVEFLIQSFENCVTSSPTDIRERNMYKYDMLVAKYKALRGLQMWCERTNVISVLKNPNFPDLTEADVDKLISRLEGIIAKI